MASAENYREYAGESFEGRVVLRRSKLNPPFFFNNIYFHFAAFFVFSLYTLIKVFRPRERMGRPNGEEVERQL